VVHTRFGLLPLPFGLNAYSRRGPPCSFGFVLFALGPIDVRVVPSSTLRIASPRFLRPFAPFRFPGFSSLLRPLLTSAPLSRRGSPQIRTTSLSPCRSALPDVFVCCSCWAHERGHLCLRNAVCLLGEKQGQIMYIKICTQILRKNEVCNLLYINKLHYITSGRRCVTDAGAHFRRQHQTSNKPRQPNPNPAIGCWVEATRRPLPFPGSAGIFAREMPCARLVSFDDAS
jgi:hypothetical protein